MLQNFKRSEPSAKAAKEKNQSAPNCHSCLTSQIKRAKKEIIFLMTEFTKEEVGYMSEALRLAKQGCLQPIQTPEWVVLLCQMVRLWKRLASVIWWSTC